MQQVLNTRLIAVVLASALLIVFGVASMGPPARLDPLPARELKELVVALDMELHTLPSHHSAFSPLRMARASKEAKAAGDEYAQPKETVSSCMSYGTATSMGVWEAALAADPEWAAANGQQNIGLTKKQGCPDPSRLELWGSICYGRCPSGFARTSLCTCTAHD